MRTPVSLAKARIRSRSFAESSKLSAAGVSSGIQMPHACSQERSPYDAGRKHVISSGPLHAGPLRQHQGPRTERR
jgi:hypothetical protein